MEYFLCVRHLSSLPLNSFNPHNGSYAIRTSVVLHFKGKEMEGQREQGNWPKT